MAPPPGCGGARVLVAFLASFRSVTSSFREKQSSPPPDNLMLKSARYDFARRSLTLALLEYPFLSRFRNVRWCNEPQ
jgi:hypothetical protein